MKHSKLRTYLYMGVVFLSVAAIDDNSRADTVTKQTTVIQKEYPTRIKWIFLRWI